MPYTGRGIVYLGALIIGLAVSYRVARIPFSVTARALWASRRRRIADTLRDHPDEYAIGS